jgi:glycosyltransferase involved in cell wall biosynthesis
MKYITFVVPCYNSEDYMDRCISSLLVAGKDAEIIIINDGSTDRTGAIAHEYEAAHPDIIRAVDQENGGHGAGINKGLSLASGAYFMVVDSDDWLGPTALSEIMIRLKSFCMMQLRNQDAITPDLIICNYVYDHLNRGETRTVSYRNVMHPEKLYTWNDIGHFGAAQYFVMHSSVFRTEVLRKSRLKLPEHVFYEDNIYAYQPLPYTEHIYYLDYDLYHYFIGRDDQSVSEKNMLERIDQQILVTKLLARSADLKKVHAKSPRLAFYMSRYISMMYAMTTVLLLKINTEKSRQQYRELWDETKKASPRLYRKLRYGIFSLSAWTNLPGPVGRGTILMFYRLARSIYKFN